MYLRVDDRLVHGQVVTAWVKQLKIRHIRVFDDTAASNAFTRKALKLAAPAGISCNVDPVADSAGIEDSDDTLVIVKTTMAAHNVVAANPGFAWTVNVGNVGSAPNRKTYADTVHLTDDEYAAVRELLDMANVEVFMQTVPGQPVNHF